MANKRGSSRKNKSITVIVDTITNPEEEKWKKEFLTVYFWSDNFIQINLMLFLLLADSSLLSYLKIYLTYFLFIGIIFLINLFRKKDKTWSYQDIVESYDIGYRLLGLSCVLLYLYSNLAGIYGITIFLNTYKNNVFNYSTIFKFVSFTFLYMLVLFRHVLGIIYNIFKHLFNTNTSQVDVIQDSPIFKYLVIIWSTLAEIIILGGGTNASDILFYVSIFDLLTFLIPCAFVRKIEKEDLLPLKRKVYISYAFKIILNFLFLTDLAQEIFIYNLTTSDWQEYDLL
ncbi:hypothetical protein TUBRATIS_003470 [Tubulinosema ratisbonensis]|uniref:Uncharacterized protein n=1 Tax=Tubulinosema ratisbonensis TaxID=291195 RepID=A0A437APV1_9MICR|nr:hypothetical protein TUBRATIS_003470 [Tubulinosema ratisbonensis]